MALSSFTAHNIMSLCAVSFGPGAGLKSKQITSQSDVWELFLAKFGNVYLIIATTVYYATLHVTWMYGFPYTCAWCKIPAKQWPEGFPYCRSEENIGIVDKKYVSGFSNM